MPTKILLVGLFLVLLVGCSGVPPTPTPDSEAGRACLPTIKNKLDETIKELAGLYGVPCLDAPPWAGGRLIDISLREAAGHA